MENSVYSTLIYWTLLKLIYFSVGTDISSIDSDYMSIGKLRKKLFTNYNKTERPIQPHSNITSINFTFAVAYSFEYDERNETFTIEGFFRLKWTDSRWVWNPIEYGGIDFFQVEAAETWLPDISIYESIPAQTMTSYMQTKPMVLPEGKIIWSPRGTFKTMCPFKADNYPKDVQICNVTFGSWMEDGLNIDFQVESPYTYTMIGINSNNKWKFLSFQVNRVVNYKTKITNPFVNIVVSTKFQRLFPVGNIVIAPSIMIIAIILMLSMFWLPPSSEKKLTLGATALFMLLGLLLYMAASAKSPLVISVAVSSVRSVIFITISALLLEIVVLIISKMIISPPPNLKHLVNGKIGKILLLNSPNKPICNEQLKTQEKNNSEDAWYKIAMATDRVFFLLFVIICILCQLL